MEIEGLPVVDAINPLTFTVTPRDVERGRVNNPQACAIAIACRRELHSRHARVHLNVTYVKNKDHWLRYMTPRSVRTEIVAFDRGGLFAPGTYTLMPPILSTALGSGRSGNRNPLKPKKQYHRVVGVRARAR